MSKAVHLQSSSSNKGKSRTKFYNYSGDALIDSGILRGILLEEVFDYIARMTHELRTMARQHNSTVLADLLLVAGEEARVQSRAASATIVPLSS